MESANAEREEKRLGERGFLRRHWKGITAGVTVAVGLGAGLYLILRGQKDDGATKGITLPMPKVFPASEPQPKTVEGVSSHEGFGSIDMTRSYTWREVGHDVTGHVRHYRNGSETYVRSYYKPTGQKCSDAA